MEITLVIMFFVIAIVFETASWIDKTHWALPIIAFAFWIITGIGQFLVYGTETSAIMMIPFLLMAFVNIAKFYVWITSEDRW